MNIGDASGYQPFTPDTRKAIRALFDKATLYPDQTLLQYIKRLDKIEVASLEFEEKERELRKREIEVEEKLAQVAYLNSWKSWARDSTKHPWLPDGSSDEDVRHLITQQTSALDSLYKVRGTQYPEKTTFMRDIVGEYMLWFELYKEHAKKGASVDEFIDDLETILQARRKDVGGIEGVVASENPFPAPTTTTTTTTDTAWERWYIAKRSGSETRQGFRDRMSKLPTTELEKLLRVNTKRHIDAHSPEAKKKIDEWAAMSPPIDSLKEAIALRDKTIKRASKMLREHVQRNSRITANPTSATFTTTTNPMEEELQLVADAAEAAEAANAELGEAKEAEEAVKMELVTMMKNVELENMDEETTLENLVAMMAGVNLEDMEEEKTALTEKAKEVAKNVAMAKAKADTTNMELERVMNRQKEEMDVAAAAAAASVREGEDEGWLDTLEVVLKNVKKSSTTLGGEKTDLVAALRERLTAKTEQITQLNKDIAEHKETIETLRSRLVNYVSDIEYKRVLSDLTTTRTNLEKAQKALENTRVLLKNSREEAVKLRSAIRTKEEEGPISLNEREELDSLRGSLTFQIKRAESAEKELSKIGDEITKLRDENTEARDKNAIVTTKLLDASMGIGPEVRDMASRMKAVYRELLSEKRISVCSPRFEFQSEIQQEPMEAEDLKRLGVYDVTMIEVKIYTMDIYGNKDTIRGVSGANGELSVVFDDNDTDKQFPTGSHILVKLAAGVEEEMDDEDILPSSFSSDDESEEKEEGGAASGAAEIVMNFIPYYETDLVSLSWTTYQHDLGSRALASRDFTTTHPLVFRSVELNQSFRANVVVTVGMVETDVHSLAYAQKDYISHVFISKKLAGE